jgi:putative cell wall-binding protein
VVIGVVALFVVLLGILAAPGQALAEVDYRSFTGADRYQTAILVSQAGFAPGVEAVVIASGETYQGALCSAPLAAAYGGPVLLTGSTIFGDTTRAEVARLAPGKIFVVDVAPAVVDAIRAAFPDLDTAGNIVVIQGVDVYDTARLVAAELAAKLGPVTGACLVPGDKFPDAIAVASVACSQGWPILLTPAQGPLPDATAQAFAALGTSSVLEAGSYVDPGIAGAAVTRCAGVDRYETAALVAEYAVSLGLSLAHVGLVTGDKFPDALAAGPYLALDGGITLLVAQTMVPQYTANLLADHEEDVARVDFIGLPTGAANHVRLLLGGFGLPAGFSYPTLVWGSKGAEVLWLEQRLTDLSYRPGPIDGVFDQKTYQAVIAFQKWEGLTRSGKVTRGVWDELIVATWPTATRSLSGTWIEVNKTKQVLLYCKDGAVVRTLPCSTGSAQYWVTPSGTFSVTRENTWETVRYKPLYLGMSWSVWAIHGYTSVPTYPASHGCIRITTWDMDQLHALVPVGTPVYIYN